MGVPYIYRVLVVMDTLDVCVLRRATRTIDASAELCPITGIEDVPEITDKDLAAHIADDVFATAPVVLSAHTHGLCMN